MSSSEFSKAGRGVTGGRLRVAVLPGVAVLLLAGCRSGGRTGTPTASSTRTASSAVTGLAGGGGGEQTSAPRSTVLSTPRPTLSIPGNVKETPGDCPYISAADFADLEGDRVGRVTVLQSRPVGCRFYFQYDPAAVVGEISIARFGTAVQAYNAMVGSAKGHPEVQSDPGIGAGAVAFQTPLQGSPSWQCVFAKGASVVTVRTRQPYPALNAFLLARVIAPKIK